MSALATSPDRHPGCRGPTRLLVLLAGCLLWAFAPASMAEPLPSWNDGPAKQAILRFVASVTTAGAPTFVPPAERIAVLDNDGTLWCEQPIYVQFAFALDRIRTLAPKHPDYLWQPNQAIRACLRSS